MLEGSLARWVGRVSQSGVRWDAYMLHAVFVPQPFPARELCIYRIQLRDSKRRFEVISDGVA